MASNQLKNEELSLSNQSLCINQELVGKLEKMQIEEIEHKTEEDDAELDNFKKSFNNLSVEMDTQVTNKYT